MEISEVRIKLVEEAGDRLQAFCSITFDDCFVIRDLKIIEGTHGPFVAMPSRKLTSRCPQCGCKNHLRAPYCNQCGLRLKDDRAIKDASGRTKLYADIAHPINSRCREMIQDRIIRAYHEELEKAKLPGYVSNYDEFDAGEDFDGLDDFHHPHPASSHSRPLTEAPSPAGPVGETTEVQPAEPRPRGPHRSPAAQTGNRPPSGREGPHHRTPTPAPSQPPAQAPQDRPTGGFGAGIL